ncbi:MAG: hypothetical protein ACYC9U_10285 [Nitrososphaerales archaeon]
MRKYSTVGISAVALLFIVAVGKVICPIATSSSQVIVTMQSAISWFQ